MLRSLKRPVSTEITLASLRIKEFEDEWLEECRKERLKSQGKSKYPNPGKVTKKPKKKKEVKSPRRSPNRSLESTLLCRTLDSQEKSWLDTKRSQEEEELRECTFTPSINNKTYFERDSAYQNSRTNQLLKWGRDRDQRRVLENKMARNKMITDNYFKPEISSRSKKLAHRQSPERNKINVEDRLLIAGKKKKDKLLELRKEEEKKMFKPNLNQSKKKMPKDSVYSQKNNFGMLNKTKKTPQNNPIYDQKMEASEMLDMPDPSQYSSVQPRQKSKKMHSYTPGSKNTRTTNKKKSHLQTNNIPLKKDKKPNGILKNKLIFKKEKNNKAKVMAKSNRKANKTPSKSQKAISKSPKRVVFQDPKSQEKKSSRLTPSKSNSKRVRSPPKEDRRIQANKGGSNRGSMKNIMETITFKKKDGKQKSRKNSPSR